MAVLIVVGSVLGCASALLLGVLVARRLWLHSRDGRRQRTEDGFRAGVLAFLDSGAELPGGLHDWQQDILAGMLLGYARTVRGPAQARVAAYMEQHGIAKRAESALRSRKSWRRAEAASRLGIMAAQSAAPLLIGTLSDPDRDVRDVAASSLGLLRSPEATEPLLLCLASGRLPAPVAIWALLQIGAPGLPLLRSMTDRGEEPELAWALQLLGQLGDAGDAAAVLGHVSHGSGAVRAQAAAALGRLGGPRSLAPLLTALGDPAPAVRTAAAEALGRLGDPRAASALLDQASEDVFEPARAAAQALVKVDPAQATASGGAASPHLREAAGLAALR